MIRTLVTCLCLLVVAARLAAGEAGAEPPPPLVYVAEDDVTKVDPAGKTVFLPYEQFIELWNAARQDPPEKDPPPPVGAVLASFALTGSVADDMASFAVTGTARCLAETWASVTLPPELAFTGFTAEGATLERTGQALALHLPRAGDYDFTAASAAAVAVDPKGRRSLTVVLPAAAGTRFELAIPGENLQVDLVPAVPAALVRADGVTTVRAVTGGVRQVTVGWQGEVKEEVGDPLLLAAMDVGCVVSERGVRTNWVGRVDVLRHAAAGLRIRPPGAGVSILKVEATDLDTWVADEATGELVLRFKEPRKGEVRLHLTFDRPLAALDAGAERRLTVEQPVVVGAARHTGNFVLFEDEGMAVTVQRAEGFVQVNPKEAGAPEAASAWRYLTEPGPVALTQRRLESELRAGVHQWLRLGKDENRVLVAVDLEVRQAGRFSVAFAAPEAWTLLDVTGVEVDEIRPAEEAVGGRRVFEVSLREKLLGTARLTCRFKAPPAIPRTAEAATHAVGLLAVDGARQVRGDLLISAPSSWALAAGTSENLAGAKPDAVRNASPLTQAAHLEENEVAALAYTFLTQDVKLDLALTPRARELHLSQEQLVTVDEGQLSGRVSWHGTVRYAALTTLTVTAPTELDEVLQWRGPNLSTATRVGEPVDGVSTWELSFNTPVLGPVGVTARYQLPLAEKLVAGQTVELAVAPLNVQGATRVESVQAVARRGSVEIKAKATDLDELAVGDVPPGLRDEGLVAAFRGPRGAELSLGLLRHDLVPLADAGIPVAQYVGHLAEDRVLKVRGDITVINRGRPQLFLVPPAGATVLEVAVDGAMAETSVRKDGSLMIPLGEHRGLVEQRVAFIYELPVEGGRLGALGSVPVKLPTVTGGSGRPITVERTELWMYLPDTHVLTGASGDLVPARAASIFGGLAEGAGGAYPAHLPDAPDMNDAQGLTNLLKPRGRAHYLVRLGDGGTVRLTVASRSFLLWSAIILGAVAVVGCFLLRRWPVALGALVLLAVVLVLGVAQPWLTVVAGLAWGVGVGIAAVVVLRLKVVVLAAREELKARRRRVPIPATLLGGGELAPVEDIDAVIAEAQAGEAKGETEADEEIKASDSDPDSDPDPDETDEQDDGNGER